jgi:hypothetical protein
MTTDEQEALSKKYVCPMVIALSSGHVALLDEQRRIIGYYEDPQSLFHAIHQYQPPAPAKPERPAKRVTITLTLEDLDL